jgi:hypothetical protein
MYLTLDPTIEWADRSDDRKERKIGRFVVTIPKEYEFPRPVFCPCCDRPMRDAQDQVSFDKNSCCFSCDNKFARPNREKWSSGWRPSPDEVQQYLQESGYDVTAKNVLDQ